MIDGKLLTEKLLRYAVKFLHLEQRDVIYTRNILLREFKQPYPYEGDADLSFIDSLDVPDVIVSELENYALENGFIEDGEQKPEECTYGKSITDPCLGWEKTERLIYDLADIL